MKKIFLVCLSLLIMNLCFSQNTGITKAIDNKIFAHQQVDSLKRNGAVIVILKGTSRAMAAYEKAGNTKVVEEMQKKIARTNRLLVKAFRMQWHFCPVYFMYNDDIAEFQNEPKAKVFVDSVFHRIPDVSLQQPYFVFMDFGTYYVPSDNTSGNEPSKWKNGNERMHDPIESNQVVEECLIVKDKYLKQFLPPYPNRSVSIMGSRDMENMVAQLNKRFELFMKEPYVDISPTPYQDKGISH